MRKRYSIDRLFEGNKLVLICVLFTVSTVIETVASGIQGRVTALSIPDLLWGLAFLGAPVLPLAVFQTLWKSNIMDENDYIFWVSLPLHFVISGGLILLLTFVFNIVNPVAYRSYPATLAGFAIGYAIVMAGAVVVDLLQTAGANQALRKIQAQQDKR